MGNFIQSPCIVCSGDMSIRQAVEKMVESNSSYILLFDSKERLEAIFTERDLISKFFLILQKNNLDKPVRTVSSHPVKFVTANELKSAPQMMIKNSIRHVPVCLEKVDVEDEEEADQLLGIIRIADIFEFMVEFGSMPLVFGGKAGWAGQKTIGIAENVASFSTLLNKAFEGNSEVQVMPLKFEALQAEDLVQSYAEKLDIVALDIDGIEQNDWIAGMQNFVKGTEINKIILLFDPKKHNEKVIPVIRNLEKNDRFLVYEKPVDISHLVLSLCRVWREN